MYYFSSIFDIYIQILPNYLVEGTGGRNPGEKGREVGGKREEKERDAGAKFCEAKFCVTLHPDTRVWVKYHANQLRDNPAN